MLADAQALYRGISAFDSGLKGANSDSDNGMHGAEAQYTQMLLGDRATDRAEVQGSGESVGVAHAWCSLAMCFWWQVL